jgi:hypothetical protein
MIPVVHCDCRCVMRIRESIPGKQESCKETLNEKRRQHSAADPHQCVVRRNGECASLTDWQWLFLLGKGCREETWASPLPELTSLWPPAAPPPIGTNGTPWFSWKNVNVHNVCLTKGLRKRIEEDRRFMAEVLLAEWRGRRPRESTHHPIWS